MSNSIKIGKPKLNRRQQRRKDNEGSYNPTGTYEVNPVIDEAFRKALHSSTGLVELLPASTDQSIKIYLDDERDAPEGWVLAKSSSEFFDLIGKDNDNHNQITHLSLDGHLTEGECSGTDVVTHLADQFLDNPQFLPNLKIVSFHSSDLTLAQDMALVLRAALCNNHVNRWQVTMKLGTPS